MCVCVCVCVRVCVTCSPYLAHLPRNLVEALVVGCCEGVLEARKAELGSVAHAECVQVDEVGDVNGVRRPDPEVLEEAWRADPRQRSLARLEGNRPVACIINVALQAHGAARGVVYRERELRGELRNKQGVGASHPT